MLTGKIEPRDEIDIKPQISGIISEILVEAYDHVNNGDIIAKIKVIPEETQLSSAESRVAMAEIALKEAERTFERTRQLYEKKYESREKYETDETALERARQDLDQARDQTHNRERRCVSFKCTRLQHSRAFHRDWSRSGSA